MAKNYDDYGYDGKNDNTGLIRKILIVLMVVIAIILIIYLLISWSGSKKTTTTTPSKPTDVGVDYENELLNSGKRYFKIHYDELPKAEGECNIVELQRLVNEKLVDAEKFKNCNQSTTYLKVCMLEGGTMHYTPWFTCTDNNSESKYENLRQGTVSDIVSDKTYLEFKFIPLEAKKGNEILGEVEELWKNDIKYEKFKTLASTKYYRYRDKLYKWNLTKRTYYSLNGDKSSAKDLNDYYVSAPNPSYNLRSDKVTDAYKWYTATGTKEYYSKNGAKAPSPTAVGDYTIKDPKGVDVLLYRTRTVTSTYSPTLYYGCKTSATGTKIIYQREKCGTGNNPEYNFTKEKIYSCANESNGQLVKANQVESNAVCKNYSSWSSPSQTQCDTTKTDICQSATYTLYYWYKLIGEVRKYYPSNSSTAKGEKVYYTSAPINGAIKDTSTKASAWKWYKESTTTSSSYTAVAPSGYSSATKSSDYRWSDWSNWSTKNPKANDGRDRTIETKTKIKLQEIKGTSSDSWNTLSTEYLTEEQLINLYKEKGYKVNTLEDISNNGQIKYQLVIFVRNKKGE